MVPHIRNLNQSKTKRQRRSGFSLRCTVFEPQRYKLNLGIKLNKWGFEYRTFEYQKRSNTRLTQVWYSNKGLNTKPFQRLCHLNTVLNSSPVFRSHVKVEPMALWVESYMCQHNTNISNIYKFIVYLLFTSHGTIAYITTQANHSLDFEWSEPCLSLAMNGPFKDGTIPNQNIKRFGFRAFGIRAPTVVHFSPPT